MIKSPYLLLLIAFCIAQYMFCFSFGGTRNMNEYEWTKLEDQDFVHQNVGTRTNHDHPSHPQMNICSNARHLFDSNTTSLELAHKELEAFHNTGGNLKSIETYLNDNMDETLKLLNLQFTLLGADKPLPSDKSIIQEIKKYFVEHDTNKRGGYDQRAMPGHYSPKSGALRGGKWNRILFDVIEPVKDFARWKNGLGPIPNICKQLDTIKPFGAKRAQTFEEKFMCSLPTLFKNDDTSSTATIASQQSEQVTSDEECHMVSIGSNGEWGFENNIIATTNCKTHTFDCTTKDNPLKPDSDSIHYHPYCITNEYKKIDDREYLTYSQIVDRAGLNRAPDLLKMDVEGFEFDVLSQMLQDAEARDAKDMLPLQISIELHYATRMYDLSWQLRQRQSAEIAMFAGMMYNKGGYVIVHTKYMLGCDSCAEVLFVRTFCD